MSSELESITPIESQQQHQQFLPIAATSRMPAPSSSRLRSLLAGLALALFSIGFCAAGLEVVFRFLESRKSQSMGGDLGAQLAASAQVAPTEVSGSTSMKGLIRQSQFPDLVYEFRPSLKATFQGQPLSINQFSMREREITLEKPADTIRIAGIGDSVMFGWGVRAEDTYLRVLEDELNARPSPKAYQTLNFGVPGYNSAMEVANFARKAVLFKPDVIVLNVINNDGDVPLFMQAPEDVWTLKKSYLAQFIREKLFALGFLQKQNQLVDLGFGGFQRSRQEVLAQYRGMIGPRGVQRALRVLARETQKREIPVIIVHGGLDRRLKKIVDSVGVRAGFTVVDLKPYVERYITRAGIPNTKEARRAAFQINPSDPHPNAAGHRIYAEALLEAVRGLKGDTVAPQAATDTPAAK